MTRSSEHARIGLLRALFGASAPHFDIAIGDDCAVLSERADASKLVWSIDAAVEGTHFTRELMTLEDAGYRATMAALSDLAAMGASPLGAIAALTLPAAVSDEELLQIARGQRAACQACGTALVGGNLARGDAIAITTSVLGSAKSPLSRAGARPGDGVYVEGELGWAAAGLELARHPNSTNEARASRALQAFRRPSARLEAGLRACGIASAMIDVSDGLVSDAGHIAAASDVTLVFDEPLLRALAPDVAVGRDPLDLVLHGGEDYALLATSREPISGFTRIGQCVPRGPHAILLGSTPVAGAGFDHFR